MRIYGNRLLKTLPGEHTRPTTAKVREALFNIWQTKIKDSNWLDICAGNGSIGAEALCRGAKNVIAIEQSAKACDIIKYNWQKFAQPQQNITIIKGDVLVKLALLKGQQFDCIYFDPPYASNLYQPVLNAIITYQLLSPNGEIAVESNPQFWTPQPLPNLEICRQKSYGKTALTFYHQQSHLISCTTQF